MRIPDLTPEELDALAEISASDKAAAVAAWKTDTDPAGKDLLDATED